MSGILQSIDLPNTAAVGLASAGLYYLFIDNESNIGPLPGYLTVGLTVGLSSAIGDWIANMPSVQGSLGSLTTTFLRPVMTGLVATVALFVAGGDLSSIENLMLCFGFGFASKYAGEVLQDQYSKRWGGYMGGNSGSIDKAKLAYQ